MTCKICQGATEIVGEKQSDLAKRTFRLVRCKNCGFAFVEDPWLDYAAIYDTAYYEGRGAAPSVDYPFELAHPARAIRRYEWSGIVEVVRRLTGLPAATRWLDFGWGNGGGGCDAGRSVGPGGDGPRGG